MTALKIVLVTAFPADPTQPRGGVEAVSVILARALAQFADLDVHVVTADDRCDEVQLSQWLSVSVHRLPWRARRILTGALGRDGTAIRRYVENLKPDVVHAHDTYGIMVRALEVPRVLTIHGFIYADTRVSGERWSALRARLWQRVETATWASYPRIISISPYVRERLADIATGIIHDIDNPIAEDFFHGVRHEINGRVFCAASISPRKNPLCLVEAMGRLRAQGVQATLTLAGPEPLPSYAEAVRARIRALGLEDRVAILPSIGIDQVVNELSAASVVALVSLEENAPLMVAEAMAAGVPVVTSNRCGMPYMVIDGETGFLVEPQDVDDVARRIQRLLENEELRVSMGAKARDVARARFHPAVVAARTREVYEAAVGAGSG